MTTLIGFNGKIKKTFEDSKENHFDVIVKSFILIQPNVYMETKTETMSVTGAKYSIEWFTDKASGNWVVS